MSTFHIDNAGVEQVVYHNNKVVGIVGGEQFQKRLPVATLANPVAGVAAYQPCCGVDLVVREPARIKAWLALPA